MPSNDMQKKILLKKAKTRKGKAELSKRLPKVFEDPKECMFLNTSNTSELMKLVLNELYLTRKTFSIKLNRKNMILNIFENQTFIEDMGLKNNASLFTFTSDTKKKPMNIVFGNIYNHKVLDLFEFEVTNFIPQSEFHVFKEIEVNSLPVLVFIGELFETNKSFERFKTYMIDFYKQDSIEEVNIDDLKRVIVFTATESENIKIRHFQVLNVSEYSINNLNIQEIGPSFDLQSRKIQISSEDDFKKACKKPKMLNKSNKDKINTLLDVQAKVFNTKQNLNAISLKRYDKILGKKRKINQNADDKEKDK